VDDGCFEQQLERTIEKQKCDLLPAPVPRAVELLDREDE
jgi:hypothetical protein